MTERDRIEVDQFLPHPPATVWRALVDPELLGRWLMPTDFQPRIGHRFTFRATPLPASNFDGTIHCQVLAIEEGRLLRISWTDPDGSGLDTTVTWRLAPEGRGTRLMLEHAGFDPDRPADAAALRGMGAGWRTTIPARLADLLSGDAATAAPNGG